MSDEKVRKNMKILNFTNKKRKNNGFLIMILFIITIILCYFYVGKDIYPFGLIKAEFIDKNGQSIKTFNLKVANTSSLRERGLMFVKELKEDDGMIFVYDKDENLVFWMKNTYIPLDLVFLNKDYKIVGIVENMIPLDDTKRYYINGKSRYAVELSAFTAKKYNIRVGDKLRIIR